jgi:hypothetical protein
MYFCGFWELELRQSYRYLQRGHGVKRVTPTFGSLGVVFGLGVFFLPWNL